MDREIKERIVKMRYGMEIGYGKEIVRCKDCKNGEKVNSVYLCGKSRGFGLAHEPDWFCADGERTVKLE